MREALQQGNADGMCGLYSVLNLLRQTETWQGNTPASDFWYILETCRRFGWLTPQFLTEGFEDYQIKAILDEQFNNYRMPFAAYYAEDVKKAKYIKSFDALVRAVEAKQGWIIGNAERRGHWLLLAPGASGMEIVDSAGRDKAVLTYSSKQKFFGFRGSVVVLPCLRPTIELEL